MADYCSPSDVYDYGIPRGAVANPARPAVATASDNAIALDLHGFEADDPVELRAEAGGTLPAPLAANTTYYVVPLTDNAFSLAAIAGGAAINLTTDGESVVVIAPFPMAKAITFASRLVDDMLPMHVVELTAPYPAIVVQTTAELAAAKLAARSGGASKSLADTLDAASKRLARWSSGVPIRGENTPARAGLAGVPVAGTTDARGWCRWGGTE